MCPVERFDAEPIAHEPEASITSVPKGEGEHADEAPHSGMHAPFRARLDDYLRIRVSAERVPLRLQLIADLNCVVDLAVVRQHKTAIAREHRLRSGWRKIHDRKTTASGGEPRRRISPSA